MGEFRELQLEDCRIILPHLNYNQSAANAVSGPGWTYTINDEPVAAGGLRVLHVAEAWWMGNEQFLKEAKDSLAFQRFIIRNTRQRLKDLCEQEKIYRVWAESKISDHFVEAMGFKRVNAFVMDTLENG